MILTEKIYKDTILTPLKGNSRAEVIQELLDKLLELKYLTSTTKLFSFIDAIESESSSATGRGVAFPHSISKEINSLVCILGISENGILYGENDVHPCHIILLSLSPIDKTNIHRKFISRFRLLLADSKIKDSIIHADSPIALETIIKNWETKDLEEDV